MAACLYYALDASAQLAAPACDADRPRRAALDPALQRAVDAGHRAPPAATASTSRSPAAGAARAYQQQLLDEAIVTLRQRARRAPATSTRPSARPTCTGKAVDIGPTDAAYWIIQHGAEFGLCQIYANEVWHFERVIAPGGTCPPLANASAGEPPSSRGATVRRAPADR